MLAAARRLGASIILLAVVYQGRSVLEGRGGGVTEARRALAEVSIVTDCTSAMQDGCCKSQDNCGSEWEPVCGKLPSTSQVGGEVTTNYTHNYTFISACHAASCGVTVHYKGACANLDQLCGEGCSWEQPDECIYQRVDKKAEQTFTVANLGMDLHQLRAGGILLQVLCMAYMFIALAIVCDEYFVPTLEIICENLNLSDDVAGATFMAAGGSMPELATSFIGTFSGSAVGFGTIVGSAVFNVLFVIGMCAMLSKETLHLTWWPLARDCSYYALSLAVLALFFGVITPCEIEWWEAMILFLMYGGYAIFMKFNVQVHDALVARFPKLAGLSPPPPPAEPSTDSSRAEVEAIKLDVPKDGEASTMRPARGATSGQVAFVRHTTFRAGVLEYMIRDRDLVDSAGTHVVSMIKGTVRETFDYLDKDKSGSIDAGELGALLGEMSQGKEVAPADVQRILSEMDINQDGVVTLAEFTAWYLRSEERMKYELDAAWIKMAGKGELGLDDLTKLVARMTQQTASELDPALMKEAFAEMDVDHDGMVSQQEFGGWYETSLFWKEHKEKNAEVAEEGAGVDLSWPTEGGLRTKVTYVVILPIMLCLMVSIPDCRRAKCKPFYAVSFFMSIFWVFVFSYLMVGWAEIFGYVCFIPDVVMGLTILAAGTSVPDLLTSVIVARDGKGDMAVSSSIGSNIFDVLVGLPLPWLIYGIWQGSMVEAASVVVEAGTITLSVLILFAMLVAVIVTIAANGWMMTRTLGGIMFFLYFLFVLQDLLRNFLGCSGGGGGTC